MIVPKIRTAEQKRKRAEYRRRYHAEHPDREKAANDRWKAKNKAKVAANLKRYNSTPARKAALRSYQRKYRADNNERLRQQALARGEPERAKRARHQKLRENPDYYASAWRRWYQKNKGSELARTRLRNLRLENAFPEWASAEAIEAIYLSRRPGEHVDHIFPLQSDWVCGLHHENNLQVLPAHENLSKSNKRLPEHTITKVPRKIGKYSAGIFIVLS
jgi:hypothetical protein